MFQLASRCPLGPLVPLGRVGPLRRLVPLVVLCRCLLAAVTPVALCGWWPARARLRLVALLRSAVVLARWLAVAR